MRFLLTLCACLLLRPATAQWVNVGPGGEGLISVSFADPNNGWICGVNAIFYRTQDGGTTWQYIPNFYTYKPHNNMLAVAATASDKVALLWQQPSVSTPATLYYSLNANNTTYYNISTNGNGDYNNLHFRQAALGLAVGNTGVLALSRDQGQNWTNLTSGTQNNLYAADSPDGNVAYVVGSGGTLRRANGPNFTTWQALNSTTTTRLTSVWFVDAQQGYLVGEGGTALRTTNGGMSWLPMLVNTTADLNAIRFINSSVGFIAGDVGTLLLTTDGGRSWQAEASNTFETLSSISATATGSTIWVAGGGGTVLKRGAVTLAARDQLAPQTWQAYPNPFGSALKLTGSIPQAATEVQLLDVTGRVVSSQLLPSPINFGDNLLAPTSLPTGVYFLNLLISGQPAQRQRIIHY